MSRELVLFVTCATAEESARIAESLVSERLAACVNVIDGIHSTYWWEGRVTRDREVLMIIKTTNDRYDQLEKRVKELHSYTTPEVIALKIDRGSKQYLDWLNESLATPESD